VCLGVILKITDINKEEAVGEIYGIKQTFRIDLLDEPKINDYVLVHAGFGISIVNEEEAMKNLKLVKEVISIQDVVSEK
jgi:hydrogenase expression/formation protein HypC